MKEGRRRVVRIVHLRRKLGEEEEEEEASLAPMIIALPASVVARSLSCFRPVQQLFVDARLCLFSGAACTLV